MIASTPHPGSDATVRDLLALALEYHRAAKLLLAQGRKGARLSRAPFRLAAIHAIELYLSALLRHSGCSPTEIRAFGHSLAPRAEAAMGRGLRLRKRTLGHLTKVDQTREYLVSRYGPRQIDQISELNRLTSTLAEIAGKTAQLVGGSSSYSKSHAA